jgi:dienelactone hydrolase
MPPIINTSRRRFLIGCGTTFLAGIPGRILGTGDSPQVPTIDDQIRKLAEGAPLTMEFRGTTSAECRKWQAEFAAKLCSLLGPHKPPAHWKTVVERSVDLKDHRREELVLTAEGDPPLPLYLLIPPARPETLRPGVLAIHGHGNFGYDPVAGKENLPGAAEAIRKFNYDYGRQLVRRGYVVAVPCLTPFGRRLGNPEVYGKQDPCAVTALRLQLLGKVLMAENLRDCLWSLEILAGHPQVDPKRLACVGLSYGGRMTMLTSALEPRIRVAVISGALNVMQERIGGPYSCGAQVLPGLLQYGDVPEIGSLIAPRPSLWQVGNRDDLISSEWADKAGVRIRRAYKALDAESNFQVDRFEGGHQWNGKSAYPVLEKILLS